MSIIQVISLAVLALGLWKTVELIIKVVPSKVRERAMGNFLSLSHFIPRRRRKEKQALEETITKSKLIVAESQRDEYKRELDEKETQLRQSHSEIEGKNKKLLDLREQFRDLKRQHGRLRIELCGSSTKSLGLSVAVQFVDSKDSALADRIRSFFWEGRGLWRDTRDIEQVRWFRNPSRRERVVIFSDHPHAAGIKGAFNNCDLLEEKVDRFDKSFAKENVPNVDIAIVVFPAVGIEE